MDPSITSTNALASLPSCASQKGFRNSSPTATASTGLCRLTLGSPGMAPSSTSSMLGSLAFVMETESPSQLSPAVIQRMSTSFTAGGRCACSSLPIARAMPCLLCASVNASPLVRSTPGSETRPLYDGEAREVRTQVGTRALTDARQLFAGKHCQHPLAAHHGADGDVPCVIGDDAADDRRSRSEEHTSELQSHVNLVCRLLLEKKKKIRQKLKKRKHLNRV